MNNFVSFSSKPPIFGNLDCDTNLPDLFIDTHCTHYAVSNNNKNSANILDYRCQHRQVPIDHRPAACESEAHDPLIDHFQSVVSPVGKGLECHQIVEEAVDQVEKCEVVKNDGLGLREQKDQTDKDEATKVQRGVVQLGGGPY